MISNLMPFARSRASFQRIRFGETVVAKTTMTTHRSFLSTPSACSAPQKLTGEEVAASVRLLTYQGTPFPWVTVSKRNESINFERSNTNSKNQTKHFFAYVVSLRLLIDIWISPRQKKIYRFQKLLSSQISTKHGRLCLVPLCWPKRWTTIPNG